MTSPLPLPPDPFPTVNAQTLSAGTVLHRNHLSAFRSAQFNPCKGQPTRFAPFLDAAGGCVATLYAATSRQAAAFETIFHDIDPAARFKTVRLNNVEARTASTISPKRDLPLAALFAPDLKLWGIDRGQIIDTPKSSYARTVLWAKAIHKARPDLDGMIWTSRQCDPERCLVLFEDRIGEDDFEVIEEIDVGKDDDFLLEMRRFGQRAGITIIA
ncbi:MULTISPECIES: RES family NAD+ phosphorylase [Rhizobium/Agrobacterium group]|uniref:RES family NAD+ phosphorylase n=2 Tax=Neorhizobium TaxID=1525371 RepID=A0ABV0MAM8_9HYPH|nr:MULTISPECIES: RES family NAD+ phosphorylase [Rhizobium/Agrobacterium group]KGD92867.1 hypothetical protein JL39_22180 [Rhizobium sp. YS-1r]MCC2611086.1 RES family NAD+ phosphorylase [Neorhizobium petrolearium]WGI66300.1 RES family NAD+ phosphorylase [Neorhizobium petrolearium]